MTIKVILSAIGSDRPGLTQALAEAVFAAGGNWLESHLTRLGGKYVGAVLVALDADALPVLEHGAAAVDSVGLRVSIVPAGDAAQDDLVPLSIEVVGQDRPGIVREVTAVLARLGVNIEQLATATENVAWSGELLFRATVELRLPDGVSQDQVSDALEAISGEIMVDIAVRP